MSKTLLAVISSWRDNELLARNWKYLTLPNWDVLGVGTVDGVCKWPDRVETINVGKLGTRMTPAGQVIFGLVETELIIWKWFLDHKEYDSVAVVEADNVFVRCPPDHPGGGLYLVTSLPNVSKPGIFATPYYFSTPRWGDRQCIERLYQHGHEMYQRGETEWDVSDRFPALICQKHRIQWMAQPAWSPPAFAWGGNYDEVWRRDAVAAIKLGVYALHSLKTETQLKIVEDAMRECGLELP